MIDWLRRSPRDADAAAKSIGPQTVQRRVQVGDRELPLVIRRLRHARRMTLRLSPDGSEVRVSIPSWGRIGDAEAFAKDRAPWLARQANALPPAEAIEPGKTLPFRGEALIVMWDQTAFRRPVVDDGQIVIGGPQDSLPLRLRRWLEGEALRLSGEDLAHYCAQADQSVPSLALSRAQRRWGSCAADGSIRINWRLIMAPDFVRQSVVAHEVAHLVHFDHSPAFYSVLHEIFDGPVDEANRWLKAHGRGLYRHFG